MSKQYLTDKERNQSAHNMMDRFLRDMERRAFLTARFATQHDEDALDLVQDAMLKLVGNYADRPEYEWRVLFHSILHNCIHDWYRRHAVRRRWRIFSRPDLSEGGSVDPETWVAQTQFLEPDQQTNNEQLSKKLNQAINQLPLRQQQALLLRAWEGYDTKQTADIMQCTQGSVKTHYARALKNLRRQLGDYQ